MTKGEILSRARDLNGYVVTKNTHQATIKLIEEMCDDKILRVSDRFQKGMGCRLRAIYEA